jgi:hypothetical protein
MSGEEYYIRMKGYDHLCSQIKWMIYHINGIKLKKQVDTHSTSMKSKKISSEILNSSTRRHICERPQKKSNIFSKHQILTKFKKQEKLNSTKYQL